MIKQLVDRIRGTRRQPAHEFVPEGWERAERERSIQGWNVESVVAAQAARLPELERTLASTSPLGCASSRRQFSRGDVTEHNTLATFAYVAALAAGGGPEFSLLDWGGGVGQYGKIAQAVLPDIRVDYYCKEVPVQCRHGRRYFPEATFFEPDHRARASVGKHLHVEDIAALLNVWRADAVILGHLSRRTNIGEAREQLIKTIGEESAQRVHFLMDHRTNRMRYEAQLVSAEAGDM